LLNERGELFEPADGLTQHLVATRGAVLVLPRPGLEHIAENPTQDACQEEAHDEKAELTRHDPTAPSSRTSELG
jgi:hypothetical protein